MTNSASDPSRRYLALWLPFLPAERMWRRGLRTGTTTACAEPDDTPRALTATAAGGMRLTAIGVGAVRLGLRPGMTLADAHARVPDLVVAAADPVADAAMLGWLADGCERWTPRVAIDPPDGLLLDIAGCAHLAGGEVGLLVETLGRFATAGLSVRGAIAETPCAARALARFSQPGIRSARVPMVVPSGETAMAVRPLPIAALGLPPATETALRRAGLKTVGDLADRPAAPLAARFGARLAIQLRRVLGQEDARIAPRRPEPACVAERHFLEPITREADALATLAQLAVDIVAILERRGQGGRVFEARFFRADGQVRLIEVTAGRPLRDADAIARLYKERLAALADPLDPGFGFDLIRLTVPLAESLRIGQIELGSDTRDDGAMAALIDRLVARFGRDHVLRFAPRDTHDPERAIRLVSATEAPPSPTPRDGSAPSDDFPPPRPIHLLDPPRPVEVIAEVPDGPPRRFRWRGTLHEVAFAEGPERIEAEWWRHDTPPPARDYFRVEDTAGRRFWIFRAGVYGRDTAQPCWFLHGLFP